MNILSIGVALIVAMTTFSTPAPAASAAAFGPDNPFFAPSKLPFQAPPFDKIKDEDYQPAIEAGMAEQQKEMKAIADDAAAPTFDNTFVAMEKSGELLKRATEAFFAVVSANSNPTLLKTREAVAPKLAAHQDAIHLDAKLFKRVETIYNQRKSLKLTPEQLRLVEHQYDEFVHAGAKLNEEQKTELKKVNEELASLSQTFVSKLLAATKAGAYVTTDKAALAGLTDAEIKAAQQAAAARKAEGYVLPLQNTTQQPVFTSLSNRSAISS